MRHFTRRISRARFRTLHGKDRVKYKQFCRDRFGKLSFIDEQTGLTDVEGASGQTDRATTPAPAALAVQAGQGPASASKCGTKSVGQRPASNPASRANEKPQVLSEDSSEAKACLFTPLTPAPRHKHIGGYVHLLQPGIPEQEPAEPQPCAVAAPAKRHRSTALHMVVNPSAVAALTAEQQQVVPQQTLQVDQLLALQQQEDQLPPAQKAQLARRVRLSRQVLQSMLRHARAQQESARWHDLIADMYRRYNPGMLLELPRIYAKYKGHEDMLYQALCKKYGPPAEAVGAESDGCCP